MQGWQVFKERVGEGFGGAPVSVSIPTTCWSAQMHACDTVANGGKLALGPGWDIEAGGLAAVPSSRHSPEVWREEDFSIDRLGLRFADGVWAEEGEKRCRLSAHCAWQRTAAPQEANFEVGGQAEREGVGEGDAQLGLRKVAGSRERFLSHRRSNLTASKGLKAC